MTNQEKTNQENNFYANALRDELERNGFKFRENDLDDGVRFTLSMIGGKAIGSLSYHIIAHENGQLAYRCLVAHDIDEDKIPKLLRTCNALNNRYRYVKLNVDKDNDLMAEFDVITPEGLESEQLGEYIMTVFAVYADTLDDCLPKLYAAMWGEDTAEQPKKKQDVDLRMLEHLFSHLSAKEESSSEDAPSDAASDESNH